MNVALGLFTLLIIGADAPASAARPNPLLFEVQIIEMKGLEWRVTHSDKLTPVAQRQNATVWSANQSIIPALQKASVGKPTEVQLVADSDQFAHFNQRRNWSHTAGYQETADSKLKRAAYEPVIEATKLGVIATVSGRAIDQGILTKIAIEETRVLSVHKVAVNGLPTGGQVEVPELANSDVAGEWLIPKHSVLIVSLGVNTTADEASMAVVKERLALVKATAVEFPNEPDFHRTGFERSTGIKPFVHASGAAVIPLPFAATPSRSLPEARDKGGKLVALPPLPVDAPPTTLPDSSEACATPQATAKKSDTMAAQGTTDTSTRQASLGNSAELCQDEEGCCLDDSSSTKAQASGNAASSRIFSFQLPWSGSMTVTIHNRKSAVADAPNPPKVPSR